MSRHRVTPGDRFDTAAHPTRAQADHLTGLAGLRGWLTGLEELDPQFPPVDPDELEEAGIAGAEEL